MAKIQPTVSIIMPAYNVASYVARAIESICHQTLENFEFFIVDDGSTDRTGEICDRYADKDIRIEVIHTQNAGAAAARNLALSRAHGKYVYFMDGDDWATTHMLSDMVAFAEENNLEFVVSGYYVETYYDDENHLSECVSQPTQVFKDQSDFRSQAYRLFDHTLLYAPWNKLFLRERIEALDIRFRDTFWDDFPFVLDYIRDVERVGVMDKAYYHFIRSRGESETTRWREGVYEKREEEHSWMLDLYKHWGLEGDPLSSEMVQRRYIERLVGCIENICDPSCTLDEQEKLTRIKQMISSDRAQLAVAVARPHSKMMKIMLKPIKSQNVQLAYTEGKFISLVKRHNTKLFATLKARR